jgi:hypothetical protein
MVHVQTLAQRAAVLNPIAFYQTANGEWDAYQVGDILPVSAAVSIYLQCSASSFKKALNKKGVLTSANAIMAASNYAVDWNSLSTFYSNSKMIVYLVKTLKKPGSFIGSIFQLANQIGV